MRTITKCRVCESKKLKTVVDLGVQYTSDFRTDDSRPPKYPIKAVICEDCLLVQLKHTTPANEMYHENYGFKSGVSDSIKADLKDIVQYAQSFKHTPKKWLDIASNDGTLLSYVPEATYKVGVDPIGFLCDEAARHADRIYEQFFNGRETGEDSRPFDVITSISCFYDMDNPNKFVTDVKEVLTHDGVWIIQQNYLLPTMQYNAVDNFCHEHLEYYTLLSLEKLLNRHDLQVIDVQTSTVNGGSIRTVVTHKGVYPEFGSVEEQRAIERKADLDKVEAYIEFGKNARDNVDHLRDRINAYKKEGKTIAILAASTRGATLWQTAGFDKRTIEYAIERNPAKVGKYFSAIGVPIISEEEARKRNPDVMIMGPWFFEKEILEREQEYLQNGGTIVVPLPVFTVVTAGEES